MSDTGVAEIAKLSTGLTYLNISRCERVGEYGDRALVQLGRSCHQLTGLDAFGCSHAQVRLLHVGVLTLMYYESAFSIFA